MVDQQTVCCMCGDVGFPDKLFRCSKCRHRFQHSYCSNFYSEFADPIEVCDWCQCEGRNSSSRHGNTSSSRNNNNNSKAAHASEVRSAYSGDKIKQQDREEGGSSAEKAAGKSPSPRPTTRRYKLLKDVMC
ncbi:hypothetical protein F511_19034 [Dorcoceras hygrometricum]|uniref:PHD-type zinc finger plants domain-containing protein n=1 Tax=Dorcoceras hygrometricum TaxID=472368 RepID=A0A2Z7CFT4_9LAMI|nr:hypothetical protein F511_19034 [Dorcoceras hygrometricum]